MWLPIVAVADLVIVLLGLAIAGILATGGGEFMAGSARVSARSIANPLIALTLLAVARFVWTDRPFTFHRRITRRSIKRAAAAGLERVRLGLESLDEPTARRAVLAVMAISLGVKLLNVFWYRGFYSGDDVEIHEMTLGLLFERDWPIWNLRSPIFPVGFIYPVQWMLVQLGLAEITPLVLAGRLVVAAFASANIYLLWVLARTHWHSIPIGVGAALLFAFNGLHVQFGSSELPRTVATTFVLAAAWLLLPLLQPRAGKKSLPAAIAGLALGLAGAIRFSEAMFLAPAALALALQKRWGASVLLLLSGAAAYIGLIALGDWLYWGSPFHSGRHIIQFTLVDRLSSRGYEPWHFYVSHVFSWSNAFAAAAVAAALALARGDDGRRFEVRRYAALWVGLPMILLSLLPHKEVRYLLPILPFWSVVAAIGAWEAIHWMMSDSPRHEHHQQHERSDPREQHKRSEGRGRSEWREWLAPGFVALLIVGLLTEADRFRFRRSADAVEAMEFVVAQRPTAVAFEESWTGGGWLYLGNARLVDLQLRDVPEPEKSLAAICQDPAIDWVVLRSRRTSDLASTISGCGFVPVNSADLPSTHAVFTRERQLSRRGPSPPM